MADDCTLPYDAFAADGTVFVLLHISYQAAGSIIGFRGKTIDMLQKSSKSRIQLSRSTDSILPGPASCSRIFSYLPLEPYPLFQPAVPGSVFDFR